MHFHIHQSFNGRLNTKVRVLRSPKTYFERSKVNHTINVRVLLEDLVKTSFLSDVDIVELRPLAANELDAVDDFSGSIVKIVSNHNFVVCLEEGERSRRTNVTTPSRSELVNVGQATDWGIRGRTP